MPKSNGSTLKVALALLSLMGAASLAGGGYMYTSTQSRITDSNDAFKDLQEKVVELSIVVNMTNTKIAGMEPKIESLTTWGRISDRKVDRIMVKLGIPEPISTVRPDDSTTYVNADTTEN